MTTRPRRAEGAIRVNFTAFAALTCAAGLLIIRGGHASAQRAFEVGDSAPPRPTTSFLEPVSPGWHEAPTCSGEGCTYPHISGTQYTPQTPVVATPAGTTYSVSHQIFGDPDGNGGQPAQCIYIFNPLLPGAQDDIVTFNGLPEFTRTDLFGTAPTVNEFSMANGDGTFLISVDSSSPTNSELFPDSFVDSNGDPLLDVCFSIGIDDSMEWFGADVVLAASVEFLKDGETIIKTTNVTPQANPWDGVLSLVINDAAGLGINQVHFELLIAKDVTSVANDDCSDALPLPNGSTSFSNVGATTDGPEEPLDCSFLGDNQVGSDIWYEHTTTCAGDLNIDLCNSFYDTKLAIYRGCNTCPPLNRPLACNDDTAFCGSLGEQSSISIPTLASQCYTVRVGGYREDQGPGSIRVSCRPGACCLEGECEDGTNRPTCEADGGEWFPNSTCSTTMCAPDPPPNDDCAMAAMLETNVISEGTTAGAGGADRSTCGVNDTADTWHEWDADCDGVAEFDLCDADFDTTLAIYDACDGQELACNDDECGLVAIRSKVRVSVTKGMTLLARVSGFNGTFGDYRLVVNACLPETGACCVSLAFGPVCHPNTEESTCLNNDGTYLGNGTRCLGDQNGNFRDDACEICLDATIQFATPLDGTVDARLPFPAATGMPNQGIGSPGEPGSPREPIIVQMSPSIAGAEDCFSICETVIDIEQGPNAVSNVVALGSGRYEIVLDRPITPFGVTTIEYLGGGGNFVEYTSHPGNVNGDGGVTPTDLNVLVGCCILSGPCPPPWGTYSCDIDHSGAFRSPDIIELINLFNGAGALIPSLGMPRPINNDICP